MHIYDESTPRRTVWRVQINWKRERTFSERQINYIRTKIPKVRGVYCIYAKYYKFRYTSLDWPTDRWSRVVYIGSGWLRDRLCAHLTYKKNNLLADYLDKYDLAYRYDRIIDTGVVDWPKTVEASILHLFENKFGRIPLANRRREAIPEIPVHGFIVQQSPNFNFPARG